MLHSVLDAHSRELAGAFVVLLVELDDALSWGWRRGVAFMQVCAAAPGSSSLTMHKVRKPGTGKQEFTALAASRWVAAFCDWANSDSTPCRSAAVN